MQRCIFRRERGRGKLFGGLDEVVEGGAQFFFAFGLGGGATSFFVVRFIFFIEELIESVVRFAVFLGFFIHAAKFLICQIIIIIYPEPAVLFIQLINLYNCLFKITHPVAFTLIFPLFFFYSLTNCISLQAASVFSIEKDFFASSKA